MTQFYKLIVTFLGLGCSPKAPGTVGSMGAFLLWAGLFYLWPSPWLLPFCLCISAVLSVLCIPLYLKHSPHKDPQEIVIDEAMGIFTMLLMTPLTPLCLVLGFILFRVFDIWKPWPISAVDAFGGDTLKNTISIIGDDVLAGLFAGGIMWLTPQLIAYLPLFLK